MNDDTWMGPAGLYGVHFVVCIPLGVGLCVVLVYVYGG